MLIVLTLRDFLKQNVGSVSALFILFYVTNIYCLLFVNISGATFPPGVLKCNQYTINDPRRGRVPKKKSKYKLFPNWP